MEATATLEPLVPAVPLVPIYAPAAGHDYSFGPNVARLNMATTVGFLRLSAINPADRELEAKLAELRGTLAAQLIASRA